MVRTDDELLRLIEEHIELDPLDDIAEARLRGRHVPVWALAGAARVSAGPHLAERIAEAYALSPDAVRAALAFYEAHRAEIDARLAANDDA